MSKAGLYLVGMGRTQDWAGMSHAGLELQCAGSVVAVLSDHAAGEARSHHQQVLGACRRGPFLPARAGQVWSREIDFAMSDKSFQASLMAQLDLVDGCVELTLQMSLEAPAEATFVKAAGASYLRHRQSAFAASAMVEGSLTRTAELITRSVRFRARGICQVSAPEVGRIGLIMAFLVGRHEAQRLAGDVEALAKAALPHGALRVDGPWPPYHFAALDVPASGQVRAA